VCEIDPALADTAAMCAAYGVPMSTAANCVLVTGRRGDVEKHVACMALATTKVEVNSFVRKRLDARKASFSAMDFATSASRMEYGGITPIGLPAGWPVWIDAAVAATDEVIVGSGIRGSKILLPGADLARLPGAEVLEGLAVPVS
jgi:prolyl-tRNA editing enzyme YbaK/EbsC (Cys-tRNA(Pro) deacylase)